MKTRRICRTCNREFQGTPDVHTCRSCDLLGDTGFNFSAGNGCEDATGTRTCSPLDFQTKGEK
jgi:hypothetical protein